MSHNVITIDSQTPNVDSEYSNLDIPDVLKNESAPNSTVTSFNYTDTGSTNRYYLWSGTQSFTSGLITDHADGTYTLSAGLYLIICHVSFQKTYSSNSSSLWRWTDASAVQYGPYMAASVSPVHSTEVGSNVMMTMINLSSSKRIGLICDDIISGTFTHSNQDTDSPAFLNISRVE